MKHILIIKKPGMVVDIGRKPVRTPAEIDITNLPQDEVIFKLRMCGIDDYEIRTEDRINPKIESSPKMDVEIQKVVESQEVDLNPLLQRFDNIEKLLEVIMSSPSKTTIINQIKESVADSSPVIEELSDEDKFIPEIDLGSVRSSGDSVRSADFNDDLEETAKLLQKGSVKNTKYKKGGS